MAYLAISLFLLLTCVFSAFAEKRNVLIILADDYGFENQAYNNTVCQTPHLNKLASHSVIFKHGYTAVSSCSPSRSSILTGLPQHQNGHYGLAHAFHHFQAFDQVKSLPVILKNASIRTGIIGKKHVKPPSVFKFDYERTDEHYPMLQVARNITHMKELVHEFLNVNDTRPFLLYVAFNDPHRCTANVELGEFCEMFGNGQPGKGVIPDWKPIHYKPEDVELPFFIQDTPAARDEIAKQYTTISRMDQGIGLFMKELEQAGFSDNTLVIFTSDNGIPFPGAKTNLYEKGMGEPFLVSSPYHRERWGKESDAMASSLDIVPTVLDWFDVSFPDYKLFNEKVKLSGKSLLPALEKEQPTWDTVFASHDFHEITMYYPMRVMKHKNYRLIHNLNYRMPYPIALDIALSATMRDILNRTEAHQKTGWFKTLDEYYYRDEWELFDVSKDPHELNNLVQDPQHLEIFQDMKKKLSSWQYETGDPWRCSPEGVYVDAGVYSKDPFCMSLLNAPPK
uniref:N-sulphoglucosamine sulphohydrolase-like n=1 Tax=Saccoglossus kowalevskii TaxID=10224 RepID=A0ABM0GJB7_SACKO|nr:PREDICTED: N-sulphoglucosamine sulphohydrolase-like [Saccoglossus kowalevskii]